MIAATSTTTPSTTAITPSHHASTAAVRTGAITASTPNTTANSPNNSTTHQLRDNAENSGPAGKPVDAFMSFLLCVCIENVSMHATVALPL
ncbi:hypothetical protein D3C81_1911480 [compost metagenome]